MHRVQFYIYAKKIVLGSNSSKLQEQECYQLDKWFLSS